jgi:hypothetical protein
MALKITDENEIKYFTKGKNTYDLKKFSEMNVTEEVQPIYSKKSKKELVTDRTVEQEKEK